MKKIIIEQILEHWNKSRDVHPCYMVSRRPVSRCQVSHFQSPRLLDVTVEDSLGLELDAVD